MRCLVTGVAGFIGSNIAERLLHDGHEVCGVDAFIDYYPRAFKEKNIEKLRDWKGFSFIEGDLLDLNLANLIEGVDWIFHQAAQAGVRASWGHEFERYVNCNVLATQRLLEASLHSDTLRRFVYASSSSVYGDVTALPVTEDVTPRPISPYGVTKLAAEHLCTLYHHNFGVPTVSLRYFTVYGPGQRPDMAFHRFCKAIVKGEPIHVFGNGQQTRDFTYIVDAVEANIRAAIVEEAIGKVMNIAGGSRVSLAHVLELLREISEVRFQVVHDQKQPGDVRDTFGDTTIARETLGYVPGFSLQAGLMNEFTYVNSLYTASVGSRVS